MYRVVAKRYAGGCLMLVRKVEDKLKFVGTGFFCHNEGYILTCAHTFSLADELGFVPPTSPQGFHPITFNTVKYGRLTIAQYDSRNDVALLKINGHDTVSVPKNILGSEEDTPIGASVCYMGFPFGHQRLHNLKISGSLISAKVLSTAGTKQFQFDALIHEGNSGGPLIDISTQQIIGIVIGRFDSTGSGASIIIGGHAIGTESTIAYAVSISYGQTLMRSEGLDA